MSRFLQEVKKDSPKVGWALGSAASGEITPFAGSVKLKTFNGPTYEVTGPLEKNDEKALQFDGTNDYASAAELELGLESITIELFVNWTTNAADDKFVMEFGPNANSTTGFNIDWNNSTGGVEANTVSIKQNWSGSPSGTARWTFARPSAGAWHHVVIVMVQGSTPVVYIDGVSVTVNNREAISPSGAKEGGYGKATLYLFSRAGVNLYGKGKLSHVAFYSGSLSKSRVEAHYAARAQEEEGAKVVKDGEGTASGTGKAESAGKIALARTGTASGTGLVSSVGSRRVNREATSTGKGEAILTDNKVTNGGGTASGSGSASASPNFRANVSCSASGSGSATSIGNAPRSSAAVTSGTGSAFASWTRVSNGSGVASGAGKAEASSILRIYGDGSSTGKGTAYVFVSEGSTIEGGGEAAGTGSAGSTGSRRASAEGIAAGSGYGLSTGSRAASAEAVSTGRGYDFTTGSYRASRESLSTGFGRAEAFGEWANKPKHFSSYGGLDPNDRNYAVDKSSTYDGIGAGSYGE